MKNLNKATLTQLWQMFRDGLADSAAGLYTAALAWRELERRGVDLTRCRTPLTNRLSAVADGKLSAAALLRYPHSPAVLDSFIGLDLDEQVKMANSDYRVPVVREDGSPTMLRPDDMTVAQVKRVFESGRIRTVEEQAALLPKPVAVAAHARTKPGRTSEVILKPAEAAPSTTAIGDAAGFAWLGLTKVQRTHLLEAAERHGMGPAQFVVYMLQDAGVFDAAPAPSKRKAKSPTETRGRRPNPPEVRA